MAMNQKIVAPVWFGNLDIAGIIADFATLSRIAIELPLGGMKSRTARFLDEGFGLAITGPNPTLQVTSR
jgi:hypothetical protein